MADKDYTFEQASNWVNELVAHYDARVVSRNRTMSHLARENFKVTSEEFHADRPDLRPRIVASLAEANLIDSRVPGKEGLHRPIFDFDGIECTLIPSSTPGNFHLYLEKEVEFDKFLKVLEAMVEAGLIQRGFHQLTRLRGAAYARKPGVKKGEE